MTMMVYGMLWWNWNACSGEMKGDSIRWQRMMTHICMEIMRVMETENMMMHGGNADNGNEHGH